MGNSINVATGYDEDSIKSFLITSFVKDQIARDYLYIMSNLIQRYWSSQTARRQQHSVKTVQYLICNLRPDKICQVLPKVIVIIDASLSSNSLRVRYAGVELAREICNRVFVSLNSVSLSDVSAVLVGLISVVEAYTLRRNGKDFQQQLTKYISDSDSIFSDLKNYFCGDYFDNFLPDSGDVYSYVGWNKVDML